MYQHNKDLAEKAKAVHLRDLKVHGTDALRTGAATGALIHDMPEMNATLITNC